MAFPLRELELSVRASNSLIVAHIETVGQLLQRTETDLLRLHGFGKTALCEVKKALGTRGLSLPPRDRVVQCARLGCNGATLAIFPVGTYRCDYKLICHCGSAVTGTFCDPNFGPSFIGVPPQHSDRRRIPDVLKVQNPEAIEKAMDFLSFREREILKLSFGFGGVQIYNDQQLGATFKLPIYRIQQLRQKAIRKMRHCLKTRRHTSRGATS